MRIGDTVVSISALAATCRSAIIREGSSSPVLKLSFNKWHGETYEESSLERRSLNVKNPNGIDFKVKNQQSFYSVELQVGTPAQNVTVLLDTGSSDLWITGKDNPYCESNAHNHGDKDKEDDDNNSSLSDGEVQSIFSMLTSSGTGIEPFAGPTGTFASVEGTGFSGSGAGSSVQATMDCSEYGTFDVKKSKTFKNNNTEFYISYGDDSFASGSYGTDHVKLANLTIDDISFAVANETNSSVGVFGIGLPENEATFTPDPSLKDFHTFEYLNFPQVLKSKGFIKKSTYSLFLNSLDTHSGDILFGAIDHSKYTGDLYTLPLLNANPDRFKHPLTFDVTLQGVGFTNGSKETTFTTTQIPALLDSGTALLYLPPPVAKAIADELSGDFDDDLGFYLIDCPPKDDHSQLVYDFGGFHIKSNLSNYLLGTAGDGDNGKCVLGVLPSDQAILGDVFLADAYVVYDLDDYEVSLAQANFGNNTKENIELISKSVPGAKKAPGYSKTWSARESIKSGGNIFTKTSSSSNNKHKRENTMGSSSADVLISSQDMANGFSPSILACLNAFILPFII